MLGRRSLPVVLLAGLGCSVGLDFEDTEGLPCPCGPGFVCLEASDRCVPLGVVEAYNPCSTDTELDGDELCETGHRCVAINGEGHRCLPSCVPVSYARPGDGAAIAAQCPFGQTCWPSDKGGVCSEGVCQDNPSRGCGAGQRCGMFNGAGVCFTPCNIRLGAEACGGTTACHPIGLLDLTACVPTGTLQAGDLCTRPEEGACQKIDGSARALICARPAADSSEDLRCAPWCNPDDNTQCLPGETCVLVRADVDPFTGLDVGVCR